MIAAAVVHGAAPAGYQGPRRALILAGGGMRLSYQAGALRALLDAGLCFTHADGTSGGALNLAMLLSGLSPAEMCQRWSSLRMRDSVRLRSLRRYLDLAHLDALGDAGGLVERVYPHLGIDMQRVRRTTAIDASFNVFNFTRKITEVVPDESMTEAMLVAGMSLPGLLPPVEHEGMLFLDAGIVRDANPLEMVRRGAEELWIVWPLADVARFKGGAVDLYVQALETTAVAALHEDIDRIREVNERIARGEAPYGHRRPIRLHLIRPRDPLPIDVDLYLGRASHGMLIDIGYADARRYLDSMDEAGTPLEHEVTRMTAAGPGIAFRETMVGGFALGATDPDEGRRRGEQAGTQLAMHASVMVRDIDGFIRDPEHAGELAGHIDFEPLGRAIPAIRGVFNLFRPAENPRMKLMVYDLAFEVDGKSYYLAGRKEVASDSGVDLWRDTTTLLVQLHEGAGKDAPVVGAGVLTLGLDDLARLASTMRVTGAASTIESAETLARFGRFFLGELWDSYARPPGAWQAWAGAATEGAKGVLRRLGLRSGD